MNLAYARCLGAEFTSGGRRMRDFLSGECVHNTGHNHPSMVVVLKDELEKNRSAMLQSQVPELAGPLAEGLCRLAGAQLSKAYFGSSGSEDVEASSIFVGAATRWAGILDVVAVADSSPAFCTEALSVARRVTKIWTVSFTQIAGLATDAPEGWYGWSGLIGMMYL
jgi:4-aminobutyrate aminotransferase-like enzyme